MSSRCRERSRADIRGCAVRPLVDNSLMSVPVKPGSQFSAGRPEKLFRLPSALGAEYRLPYVPSADGRRFLIAVPENSQSSIQSGKIESTAAVVVTNWMEALIR